MDLGKLVDEAKELVEERGGVESLTEDAEELITTMDTQRAQREDHSQRSL